jgi:Fic family protein
MDHINKALPERQRKVMNLLLDAGPGAFNGDMSTKKYENITGTSLATASRELVDLESMGLLKQVGARRSPRYHIALPACAATNTP